MLTQERLKAALEMTDRGRFIAKLPRGKVKAGDEVGWLRPDGYRGVGIDGKSYLEHHLVFLHEYGRFPIGDIDHVDMDRSNNSPSNLREVTRSQNELNTKAHKDSRSGVKNGFFRKDSGKYSVRVSVNGKYKNFGCYESLELAKLVATEVREKYHGEYCNHGTE